MARRRKDAASVTLTIRMTKEDRALLDRLVAKRAMELADEGLDVTATSVIRGMIRREARSLGLLPPLGASPALRTPPPPKLRAPRAAEQSHVTVSTGDNRIDDLPVERARMATPPQPPELESAPIAIPTPMVPTGMGEPRDLSPYVIDEEDVDSGDLDAWELDAEQVRERAVRAIRRRRFRQRDLVERAAVPQQEVSRFLLGANVTTTRLRAIAEALEQLDV